MNTMHYLSIALLTVALGFPSKAATLALHYTFDEGSGTTAASEVNSNVGNTLNLTNATFATGKTGFGTALSINTTAGRAQAATASSWSAQTLASSGSISMALWVNLTTLPTTGTTFLMGATQQSGSFHHQTGIRLSGTTNSTLNSVWGQGGGSSSTGTVANVGATSGGSGDIDPGVWTHVAITFDTSTKTVVTYMDGIQAFTSTNTSWDHYWPSTDLVASVVGAPSGATSVIGFYDDVRIYDGVLTSIEVADVYAIPEPSSLSVLGLGSLALLRRRRS